MPLNTTTKIARLPFVHLILEKLVCGEVYRLMWQIHAQLRHIGSIEGSYTFGPVNAHCTAQHRSIRRIVHLQSLFYHLRWIRNGIVDECCDHTGHNCTSIHRISIANDVIRIWKVKKRFWSYAKNVTNDVGQCIRHTIAGLIILWILVGHDFFCMLVRCKVARMRRTSTSNHRTNASKWPTGTNCQCISVNRCEFRFEREL